MTKPHRPKGKVNNRWRSPEQLAAVALIDSLRTAYPQLTDTVVHSPADRAFLAAWWNLGRSRAKTKVVRSYLKTPLPTLSPLGQAALLSMALGITGKRLPRPLSG